MSQFRSGGNSLSRRPGSSKQLGFETLEDRQLMAGNVTAVVNAGRLDITGDASANSITINFLTATNRYQIIGNTAGGSNTTINGVDANQAGNEQFINVSQLTRGVVIRMNAGDDVVNFASGGITETRVPQSMDVLLGDGNDTFTAGRVGNQAGGADPIASTFIVQRFLTIVGGGGNDTIDVTNAQIGRDLHIDGDTGSGFATSDGNDTIRMATTFTPSGGTEQTFPVSVGGDVRIRGGGGNDLVQFTNLNVGDDMRIEDAAGALTLTLTNVNVNDALTISKSGGVDTITLQNISSKSLTMDTGSGNDVVTIRESDFRRVNINLGAGRDTLTIGTTDVSQFTVLDGDRDRGVLTLEAGNQLRGLVRRKFQS